MAALKILIVEDSKIASDILKQALESDAGLQIVGIARNGREALDALPRLSPDLITMDVWMPVMDGFETVEQIMAQQPTPILVITSSRLQEDVQLSMRMLGAGALDVIEKPNLTSESQWLRYQQELAARVKLLAGVKVITHLRGRRTMGQPAKPAATLPLKGPTLPRSQAAAINRLPTTSKPLPLSPASSTPKLRPANPPPLKATETSFPSKPFFEVIAIASSTGGPTALLRVLQALPPNLPCGILVVQHISEGFTQGLVDWLQREISLKVKMGQDNDRVLPGQVLLAPDGRDMLISLDGLIMTAREGFNILRPSADVMMHSVAQAYQARAIGLVLTGMGSDGASGLLAMRQAQAHTIAQDEATSLIYGMPKAAADNGAAREVIALDKIASRLIELLQQGEGGSG